MLVKPFKLFLIILIYPALLMNALPLRAEQGDWLVRARGIVVHPNDSSGLISLGGTPDTTPVWKWIPTRFRNWM